MKIHIDKLTLVQLNWAVAQILLPATKNAKVWYMPEQQYDQHKVWFPTVSDSFDPTHSWEITGPLIEQERIHVWYHNLSQRWIGSSDLTGDHMGLTALEAAVRAYVGSYLGEEIEVPE